MSGGEPLATSRLDVAAVANRIRAMDDSSTPAFAARLLTDGLMRAGWFMRACHRVLKWRTSMDTFEAWGLLFSSNMRGERGVTVQALDFREQTAKWCENGKDTSSRLSAGGFNQAELDRVVHLLRRLETEVPA